MVAHEYAHAAAAYRQGDDTAFMLGRLTLNPLKHIDPLMTVIVPVMLWYASHGAFTFGAAKPVPVNPRNYRNYRRGDIIVSLAGIATNVGLYVACAVLFVVAGVVGVRVAGLSSSFAIFQRMLDMGMRLNLHHHAGARRLHRRAGAVLRPARSAATPHPRGRGRYHRPADRADRGPVPRGDRGPGVEPGRGLSGNGRASAAHQGAAALAAAPG